MNWWRGTFRLWVFASVIWVALAFVLTRPDWDKSLPWNAAAQQPADPYAAMLEGGAADAGRLQGFAIFGLIPVAILFGLGAGALWAFAGFKRR